MHNIKQLFLDDLKRITANTITGIIVLGLVLLPSIFSWYNVLACWDVFENVDSLKVAVANTDEGYESDLVPLKVHMGEQVVSQLRASEDMNWVFTDEEDAIDGAKSGKYYAAVVIPATFSKDMLTFYSDDVEHAKIIYYSNEKKNVVAPKLTDKGADQISSQVNEAFARVLAEVGLNVAAELVDYADNADVNGRIGQLANHVDSIAGRLGQSADVVESYASVLDASSTLISGSAELISQAGESAQEVEAAAQEGTAAVAEMTDASSSAAEALDVALGKSAAGYAGLSSSIDAAFDDSIAAAETSAPAMRDQAAAVRKIASVFETLGANLSDRSSRVPEEYRSNIQALAEGLDASAAAQYALAEGLDTGADAIADGAADAKATRAETSELAQRASQSVSDLSEDYHETIKPQLEELAAQISALSGSLSESAQSLEGIGSELSGDAQSLAGKVNQGSQTLRSTAADLRASSDKLSGLANDMRTALASGDTSQLRELLSNDASVLSAVVAAPVELDRHAVFPAENFGSQMAPLYTTLGVWIGSLLLVVAIKTSVSRKARARLDDPKLWQLFIGRFGVFAVVSLLQTTVMAAGNMFFLGLQVSDPLLYLVCFWGAGLVFTFIIYSFVVSFANLGKALGVLMLILQVTCAGGSFPLQVLPEFFQVLSPYMPATHVINAMRAAMMGVYMNDFWIEMGLLALFVIPAALLGLVLRKPTMKFLHWYLDKVEESQLVS